METLEFIIYPDGRVEERVTGLIGSSCAEVTALIEAKLGVVVHRELTSESFVKQQAIAKSAIQQDNASDSDTLKFSQW
ncbi:DUF2997 domain-containing protein [Pseudanabaena biceps]|nr:DUF2997 domain-containing protein [Pseudanabaena biceps]